MAAQAAPVPNESVLARSDGEVCEVTLLELIDAVCSVTEDDAEVMATVLHMLVSGSVRLRGNFRGCSRAELRRWAESA